MTSARGASEDETANILQHGLGGRQPTVAQRWQLVADASVEVGPALFFSLLVITLSFVPVFLLEAQEGRLFSPLAFTKTYAMAAATSLSVTLIPVLMGYLIRGRIPHEAANPVNRFLMAVYGPARELVLRTLAVAAVLLALTAVPLVRLGGKFMPPLDEGDLLYMPSALQGLFPLYGLVNSGLRTRERDLLSRSAQRASLMPAAVTTGLWRRMHDFAFFTDSCLAFGLPSHPQAIRPCPRFFPSLESSRDLTYEHAWMPPVDAMAFGDPAKNGAHRIAVLGPCSIVRARPSSQPEAWQ
ncbi:hypothetical protein VCH24_34720 [Variovorax boronicumulans]|nr:hypothetical protein VCH24_34720 [Variovorax boronicumulans]